MENEIDELNDKSILINALWNAFPSVESFKDFKEKDREVSARAIPRIIKSAYKKSIIEKDNEKSFIKFLATNNKIDENKPLPDDLTFTDVLEVLSGNISVNSLITQLENITKKLSLPKIKASMITRLKKHFVLNTAKKRTLLRILAYKLAEKRPDLNWNYEMLRKITIGALPKGNDIKEKAGVTITLHLQSRGEIITPTDVSWLKTEISKCIEYLNFAGHVNKKTIASSGATSFSLKLPKKQGPAEQPRHYDKSIRDSLAIAHQMAVRWLLSEYSSPKKHLIIIIHAGVVSEANLVTQPLLEAKLTGETGIYLTDFAYLCTQVAEVKVGCERYNNICNSDESYISDVWAVKYFWAYNYYDYIPYLLEDRMLPRSDADSFYNDFHKALCFPEQAAQTSCEALWAMHRFPKNSMLLIEIAKVLRARLMPHEADAVLSNLLLSNPHNIVARIMRMIIYSNIAQEQKDFFISEMAFEQAIAEGEVIAQYCDTDGGIWCEFGLVYYGKAIKYLKYLGEGSSPGGQLVRKEDVLNNLMNAKKCFHKALAVYPTGKDGSSIFWLLSVLILMEIVSAEGKIFGNKDFDNFFENNDAVKKISVRFFRGIGLLRDDLLLNGDVNESASHNFLSTIMNIFARFDNSMLSRSYIPYVKYLYSLLLWDFMPHLTVETCKIVLTLLNEARMEAEKLIEDNLCVYKLAHNFVAPEIFTAQIQETVDLLRKYITDNDLKKEGCLTLAPYKLKELSKIKFMLLDINWR